eukprot:1278402-Amphidinium_carterae.1
MPPRAARAGCKCYSIDCPNFDASGLVSVVFKKGQSGTLLHAKHGNTVKILGVLVGSDVAPQQSHEVL